jgi:hypothetical protein
MWAAMRFVQEQMDPLSSVARFGLPEEEFNLVKDQDLGVLIQLP